MESVPEQARAVSEAPETKKRKVEVNDWQECSDFYIEPHKTQFNMPEGNPFYIVYVEGYRICLYGSILGVMRYRRPLNRDGSYANKFVHEDSPNHRLTPDTGGLKIRRKNNIFEVACGFYLKDRWQSVSATVMTDIEVKDDALRREQEAIRQKDDALRREQEAIRQRDTALRQKDDAISHAADAIREKDDVTCRLDNALGTECQICHNEEYERCFLGKICANDCNHKCCIHCLIDMGFNRLHICPWCRGELSPEALQDLRNLDRKLRTPAFLSRPTTPRNRVQDSLHFIMQGQLPDLTPQQISRRLDDLFAQAPTTVTEMFEAALPPAPETPVANVSGSNTTVVNGTTYHFDD